MTSSSNGGYVNNYQARALHLQTSLFKHTKFLHVGWPAAVGLIIDSSTCFCISFNFSASSSISFTRALMASSSFILKAPQKKLMYLKAH